MAGSDITETERLAARVISAACSAGLVIATAESCTGGLVMGALTGVPGSSAAVDRGFVTYSNAAKAEMLGVDPALIEANGAVSEPVARAMAEGALAHAPADLAVAITGIAGPGGATDTKPIGRVHFAVARRGETTHTLMRDYGEIGRADVRAASVTDALRLLLDRAGG